MELELRMYTVLFRFSLDRKIEKLVISDVTEYLINLL